MKRSIKTKNMLEAILVIGLILIIPLFFAINSAANQPEEPNTVAPASPAVAASVPEESNELKPKQPPACTFPLAEIKAKESKPEEYVFSEPQVVLTAPEGNPLNVAQWLPDNQQVLITEGLHNQYVDNNNTAPQQSISLYNLETGKSKLYAIRTETDETEMWQPELNGVVYSALNFTSLDKAKGVRIFTRQLWVSYGDPDATQLLADNLQFPFVVKPNENEILYLSDKKMSKLDKSLKKLSLASFDPDQWDYAKSRRNDRAVSYQMAWQPGTPLVFLYSGGGGSLQGGYTFVVNTSNGHICELDLGGPVDWAARWSSDGRYLAFARAKSYTGFSDTIDLAVLDSVTGDLRTIDVVSPDVKGQHYVTDLTWTPDNLHLLVFVNILSAYDSFETMHHKLYFVDFVTGQNDPLFPEFKSFFAEGIRGMNNFVWSPDGSKLLARCPVMGPPATNHFCLISVQRTEQ
jgi:hypothetical protein